ncbi:host nuclease inhibitor protein [Paremcibacter congregatus]|uniref:host nuclease inhibitor protein n=1 Tax=Paremcibacter congregatus TaxID=2043170 RepID=UPI0030EBE813|tara:strand:+ start:5599 stop:5862 length:264 start_codon:yes stop_codon:yes gene_type:complete
MNAYVWRSGLIEFDSIAPLGALLISEAANREIIEVLARHSRVSNKLFVPGIPEADTDFEAMEALLAFQREYQKRLTPSYLTMLGDEK